MKLILFYLQLIIFSFAALAQGLPSIELDPSSGNYIITYIGVERDTIQTFFEPATKINGEIKCKVSFDSSQYSYNYKIYNGSTSQQRLFALSVEYFSDLILVNRPDSNWYSDKFKYFDIRNWANITSNYGVKSQFDGIAPDSSQDGFSIVSLGLPTILNCYLRGASSTLFFPEEPPIDVIELLKPLRNFPNNTVIKKTVGPKDPPNPFIPLDFLDTLLNYNQRSLELGWITNQNTADKYDSLFNSAKTQLQQNNNNTARTTLQTILQEVDVDVDSTNNLTSEAYTLLRYNTEYLIEHLPEGGESISTYSVFATHSIWLKQNSDILSGGVGVNEAGEGPFLASQLELAVGKSTTTPAGYTIKGNRIIVKQNATVNADVYYNELTNNGTITGELNTPLELPLLTTLPEFKTSTPGEENIVVPQNGEYTLLPGSYNEIQVKKNGKLIFTGGEYNIFKFNGGDNNQLIFQGESEVKIADKFDTGQGSYIGPEDTTTLSAKDIVFYVEGINGNNGNLGATPKAAKVGLNNIVFANFYVPNGTLWLRQNCEVKGAFIGKDVIVGLSVQVKLNSAW